MKRITGITVLILLCFIFAAYTLAFSAEIKEESSEINLDSTSLEFNLGNINMGDTINKTIVIRNKLNEALQIKEAISICECIRIYTKPQMVDKDGIFEVDINFDTTGLSDDVEEVVYIIIENMKYEIIRLAIMATIVK